MNNVLLIGLGPHSKRIYIRNLQSLNIVPSLIIDLESKYNDVKAFVNANNLSSDLFFIPEDERNRDDLTPNTEKKLDFLISKHKITHAILSTEPKAHYAYLKFLIKRKIPTLTDKPVTSPVNVCNDENQAKKIHSEYHYLISLINQYKTKVTIQCQRRYDIRYLWIAELIRNFTKQYSIPISHIQINHCDGTLNMPDEFFTRENHPYKYGYGKLFHSGYHFIDLLNFLLSYDQLPLEKRPTDCFLSTVHYSPHDQLIALNESFYKKNFKSEKFNSYYKKWNDQEFLKMGELDFLALIEFFGKNGIITTCSLNLLQSGFSRRTNINLPSDTYKGNGRVRHEYLNIQFGPLMNIQVHSYQAYEIKERNNKNIDHEAIGGLEHFDIHIFRNSEIIGGLPHEIIKGKNLFHKPIENSTFFMGYNEYARKIALEKFLNNEKDQSFLEQQHLTIDLITNAYVTICRKRNGKKPVLEFKLTK